MGSNLYSIFLDKKVYGVIVQKGQNCYKIEAPVVISSAGLYNTFQRLLKPEIAKKSYFSDICKQLKPGLGTICVFLGLDASNEELNLVEYNTWAYVERPKNPESDVMDYLNLTAEEALDAEIPFMQFNFPSAKDPYW